MRIFRLLYVCRPVYAAEISTSKSFGSLMRIDMPCMIRYSSPLPNKRTSGINKAVPFTGGRIPPPRRGTPLTNRMPYGEPMSVKCPRLTPVSLPSHELITILFSVPGICCVGQ